MNADSDPETMVGDLEEKLQKVLEIGMDIEKLKRFQTVLELPPDDFHDLETAEKAARVKLQIWKLFRRFTDCTGLP